MNADEWLIANGKSPWQEDLDDWYWATYLYYDHKILTEEDLPEVENDWRLPIPIWNHLQTETTYPYVKMYKTREEALEDFRQAYDKAVLEGTIKET